MTIDPVTAGLIWQGVSAAAEAGSKAIGASKAKKAAKRRFKEEKRETYGDVLNEAQNREAELRGHRLSSGAKFGRRHAQSLQETSDLVRKALS